MRPILLCAIAGIVAVGLLVVSGSTGQAQAESPASQPAGKESSAMQNKDAASQPASQPAAAKTPRVVMETSLGRVVIELYPDKAPVSVENFLKYVDDGFYNDTVFHRVVPRFVIQGGGFDTGYKEKPTRGPIRNEARNGLKNGRGTLAMARTADPNSATSQFYVNLKDNTNLDYPSFDGYGYAVFGKVVEGMDAIDKIAQVRTGSQQMTPRGGRPQPFTDVPREPVVIQSMKRQ